MRHLMIMPCLLMIAGATSAARAADPAPPTLSFAFEEEVLLDPDVPQGMTPMGGRNIVPIIGGTFSGPRLRGTIMPGGWDWQLKRADGCLDIKADYFLKTDDGVIINLLNTGVACPPVNGVPVPVRNHPRFEAPTGRYDWLNRGTFVGTLERGKGGHSVIIRFYEVQ